MVEQNALAYARLQLHIQHPEFEECWLDGYESAQNRFSEEDNPYSEKSTEYKHWSEGWWAGFYQEPSLFDLSGKVRPSLKHSPKIIQVAAKHEAANHAFWTEKRKKLFFRRSTQIAIALCVAVAAYELADVA